MIEAHYGDPGRPEWNSKCSITAAQAAANHVQHPRLMELVWR